MKLLSQSNLCIPIRVLIRATNLSCVWEGSIATCRCLKLLSHCRAANNLMTLATARSPRSSTHSLTPLTHTLPFSRTHIRYSQHYASLLRIRQSLLAMQPNIWRCVVSKYYKCFCSGRLRTLVIVSDSQYGSWRLTQGFGRLKHIDWGVNSPVSWRKKLTN